MISSGLSPLINDKHAETDEILNNVRKAIGAQPLGPLTSNFSVPHSFGHVIEPRDAGYLHKQADREARLVATLALLAEKVAHLTARVEELEACGKRSAKK
jgi:hypothetical protein